MKRFIEGEDRHQSTLLPEYLDDYIAEDNSVRVIEVFIDELDLLSLGFSAVEPQSTGRPGYHPATLLKIYVYGYLNRIQSSRRLERESQRNVELMWLTGRLALDFKTIADFRKDNGEGIRSVCREFVGLCRQLELFSDALVAIDGSRFKAVNNRDRNFTQAKIKRRLKNMEKSLDQYFSELDHLDQQEASDGSDRAIQIDQKITALKQQMRDTRKLEAQLLETPDKQISLTDPDARAMSTSARGSGLVGYNVHSAVDTKHHLIVEHEVTNEPSDRGQLSSMAKQTRTTINTDNLTIIADRGYYNGEEIKACVDAGITPFVSKPRTSGNKAKGLFDKRDFRYIEEDDEYRCPAGERLPRRTTAQERGKTIYRYWSSNCQSCSLKSKCTTGKERRVSRWEHEAILESVQASLERNPEMMLIRKQTVEHPFGTIKSWMGSTHFLMKRLPNVQAEMSLHVLAYNLRRAINVLGVPKIMEQLQAA